MPPQPKRELVAVVIAELAVTILGAAELTGGLVKPGWAGSSPARRSWAESTWRHWPYGPPLCRHDPRHAAAAPTDRCHQSALYVDRSHRCIARFHLPPRGPRCGFGHPSRPMRLRQSIGPPPVRKTLTVGPAGGAAGGHHHGGRWRRVARHDPATMGAKVCGGNTMRVTCAVGASGGLGDQFADCYTNSVCLVRPSLKLVDS